MKRAFMLGWLAACGISMSQDKTTPLPLVVGISLGEDRAPPSMPDDAWRVADFEADEDGHIWGIAESMTLTGEGYVSPDGIKKLATFNPESKTWQPHAVDVMPDGAALQLLRLSDGSVACLWRSGKQSFVTKHRDGKSTLWATLDAVFYHPRLSAGLKGELLITETGPKLASISSQGGKPEVLTIPDELLAKPEKPDEPHRHYAAVHALHAGDGSVWLWCYALQPNKYLWRIQGFLRLRDGKLERVKELPFSPEAPISAVLADGAEHLLAAEAGAALWRIPLNGAQARRLAIADSDFAYIEHLARSGEDFLVLTCPQPNHVEVAVSTTVQSHLQITTTRYYDTAHDTGTAYRVKKGKPAVMAQGIDDEPHFGRSQRCIVSTDAGLMIGTGSGSPTWIKAPDGKARRLGREAGFGLRSAVELLPLEKNRWLVRSSDTTWAVISTEESTAAPARMTLVKTVEPMVQDKALNIWAWRDDEEGFARWSGKWIRQPGPPVPHEDCLDITVDQHDQAWLISGTGGRSAVLDLAKGEWSVFESPEQAVEKKLTPGDHVDIPRYLVCGLFSHPGSRKGFLDWQGTVHVLQGGQWTRSKLTDIGGPNAKASGVPYFDSDGLFCIPVEFQHHRLRTDGQWELLQGAKTEKDRTYDSDRIDPPQEAGISNVTSAAYDRHGVLWMTQRNGTLWKWLPGAAVKLISSDGLPFLQPYTKIKDVLVDTHGNAMLQQADSKDPMLYHCLAALPQANLEKAGTDMTAEGVPVVIFPKVEHGWHRHRIQDGPWSPLTQEPRAVLETLTAGRHRVDVQSFDAELTPVGTLQELTLQREALATESVAVMIAELASDSLERREKAALALRTQGRSALPRLREALEKTEPGSSHSWWLSGVIQAIETNRSL